MQSHFLYDGDQKRVRILGNFPDAKIRLTVQNLKKKILIAVYKVKILLYFLPIGFTRVLSNSSAFCGKWLGLYGGKLRRSKILDVEVLKGVELVVAVVVAARGDPETNEGHLLK